MALQAYIQILFPLRPDYGVIREQQYLWPPYPTSCDVDYPDGFDIDFTEQAEDVRLLFRNVLLPTEEQRERLQLGNVLVIYNDQVYRVETGRPTRRRRRLDTAPMTMTLTAQRVGDYDPDAFTELEAGGRALLAGDAYLGVGATR